MPVVAAAVVPHSPLLLPTVAKDHADLFRRSRETLADIAAEFYARQVNCVLLFTPHGEAVDDIPTINVQEQYSGRLLEFGDAVTEVTFPGAHWVAQRLKRAMERQQSRVVLTSRPELDYGSTVPLTFFQEHGGTLNIVPIAIPLMTPSAALAFGQAIHDFSQHATQRIGLIASCDWVRRDRDPHPRPLPLERTVGQAIGHVDPGTLLTATEQVCGLTPLIVLLAALQNVASSGTVLSFEAPLKVGAYVARFDVPS